MRKELIVYVNTMEKEEFSVQAVAKNRDYVIINSPAGKFTASVEELKQALEEIKAFDTENNKENEVKEVSGNSFEVEYGEN